MVYGRWHLNELFYSLFLFCHYILAIYHMYFSIVLVYVCLYVFECAKGWLKEHVREHLKEEMNVKTSTKYFFFRVFFFNLKSLVILYFLDPPHKESFFFLFFQKGREGGEIMCRKQFGYQVLFSSVFLKTFNTSYNFVFYAIIIIIIIIHWELLCVCIYRDDMFIQKGKDFLSGPAEIWFLKNVLKATLEIRVRDVNILLNHPITDLHDAICVQQAAKRLADPPCIILVVSIYVFGK